MVMRCLSLWLPVLRIGILYASSVQEDRLAERVGSSSTPNSAWGGRRRASPGSWTEHTGLNCWKDYGGWPADPSDTPLTVTSAEACKQACMQRPDCVAVTVGPDDFLWNSPCYLRVALQSSSCQTQTEFNTYTNGRNPFKWITDIEMTGGHHSLAPGTYYIDRQYVLPSNTHLEGAGEGKTIIQAVRYTSETSNWQCGENYVNRIGLIVGDNNYVGKFTFNGADWKRPDDSGWLCGGGAIETPGCAWCYCTDNITTGKGDGNGVRNVVIEDIAFPARTVQSMFFMPETLPGKRVSSNFTIRNLRTNGTWADSLNIHGGHKNILVENCSAINCGDDCFAVWDTFVENEFLTNITFRNNQAANPHISYTTSAGKIFQNDRDCFSQFGGRSVNYIDNQCSNPTYAMIHFWTQFCGSGYYGSPSPKWSNKMVCYPQDSVSYVSGNTLTNSSLPKIFSDAGDLPSISGPKIHSDIIFT